MAARGRSKDSEARTLGARGEAGKAGEVGAEAWDLCSPSALA